MTGRVTSIYLRPSARTPVRSIAFAHATAGTGLDDDHAGGGNRQVTLVSKEQWAAACEELAAPDLDPQGRRANILIEGLPLAESIGGHIEIAECRISVIAELAPCRLMDDYHPGLQNALKPDRRGGVYGKVVRGGDIKVGDEVTIVPRVKQEKLFQ